MGSHTQLYFTLIAKLFIYLYYFTFGGHLVFRATHSPMSFSTAEMEPLILPMLVNKNYTASIKVCISKPD